MLKIQPNFMKEALHQAALALEDGEIPVGAVVVCEGQIISRAYNQVQRLQDPTAHAEMIAITSAAGYLSNTHLRECTLYVTLEPCPMCMGAIREAQIGKVVFGAADNRKSVDSVDSSQAEPAVVKECEELIATFFSKLRGEGLH